MDRSKRSAHALRVRLGDAIRQARGDWTQAQLAEAIGVDQPTVSKWEAAKMLPSIEDVVAVEKATGRPGGFVFRSAGLVDEVVDIPSAIAAADLTDKARAILLGAFRAAEG